MYEIEDIVLHGRSLKEILDLHKLFLNTEGKEGECANLVGADLRYTKLEKADLSGANLSFANLRFANLSHANLEYANLEYANLSHANLKDANLGEAKLEGVNLEYARLMRVNLYNVDLYKANLREVDLRYANLYSANLGHANLTGADLSHTKLYITNLIGANLFNANLFGAMFENIIYDYSTLFYVLQCPEEGSFIGYKKAGNCIVKLKILEDSKRSSGTTRKCRCDKALVLDIENIETGEKVLEVPSDRDKNFIYRVGEEVSVDNFNENRWLECTTGIHFFMSKHEAENYFV